MLECLERHHFTKLHIGEFKNKGASHSTFSFGLMCKPLYSFISIESQIRGKYDMVRLLLKLGSSPNTVGGEGQEGDITPIDACIFGCSITPPEYGRNVTSANWLEYFEDHFRNI